MCRIKGTVSPRSPRTQGALLAVCCYLESSGFPALLLSGSIQVIKHRLLLPDHSLHLPGAAGILWPLFCSPALMAVIVTHLHFRCCYQAVILLHIQTSCLSPGLVTLLLVPRQLWANIPARHFGVTSSWTSPSSHSEGTQEILRPPLHTELSPFLHAKMKRLWRKSVGAKGGRSKSLR